MTRISTTRRVVVACTLRLPGATMAFARASLVRATIAPGQMFLHHPYPRLPAAAFAENVNPNGSFLHVFEDDPRSDHALVDLDNDAFPFKNPKEITVGLPRRLRGIYTVLWFTASADDGHKAAGAYTFTVTWRGQLP